MSNTGVRVDALLYTPAGFVMIRTPLLPVDAWLKGYEDRHTELLPDSTEALEQRVQRSLQRTQDYLQKQIRNPIVREALLVASPDLFQALPAFEENPASKKGQRVQTNVLRYLSRMTTRATPFGLFAGVTGGQIGDEMAIQIAEPTHHRKRTRPDMQWLMALIRDLEQRAEVAHNLRFFTNPALFISAERLYIPYLDGYGQVEEEKVASMRATSVVRTALEFARHAPVLNELKTYLLQTYAGAREEQVLGLLHGLRSNGALLSTLRPPLTNMNTIQYVLDQLEDVPHCEVERQQLRELAKLLSTYDEQPLGSGEKAFHTLYEAAMRPETKVRSTIEVDMSTTCTATTFSNVVAQTLATTAETLLRISQARTQNPALEVYRQEFIERYGSDREVPLLELLDDDIGMGPPPGYLHPPRTWNLRTPIPQEPKYERREKALLALAGQALYSRQPEVELTEAIIKELELHTNWRELAPDSFEMSVYVAAGSQEALNQGQFQLVLSQISVKPAGRTFGRFGDLIPEGTVQELKRLALAEEQRHPEKIFAELVYMPMHGHAANVAIRPVISQYEVIMSTSPGVPFDRLLSIDDLVVGVKKDRFYVRSRTLNAEVVIRVSHVLNTYGAPNICRFLSEIGNEGTLLPFPFDWGPAEQLPFVPRVRLGNAVLGVATWRLSPALLDGLTEMPTPTCLQWYQRVLDWRRQWNVPRYVYLTEMDNRLLLDLENPLCLANLGEELWKRRERQMSLSLEEMYPSFDDLWAQGDGQQYLQEFVIPFVRQQFVAPDTSATEPMISHPRSALSSQDHFMLPGSDWLYAKLYCGTTRQNDLLAGAIHELFAQLQEQKLVTSAFYIRYRDPEPHLRLRFQGNPQILVTRLFAVVSAWGQQLVHQGWARNLVFDSYDREIERYGGPEGMPLSEQLFAADSQACADIIALQLRKELTLPIDDVVLLSLDDLLVGLGIPPHERRSLYQGYWQRMQALLTLNDLHKRFHHERKNIVRLIGDSQWLAEQPGGMALLAILQQRSKTIQTIGTQLRQLNEQGQLWVPFSELLTSYMHMHCNRLVGIDRRRELGYMYFLDRTFESLQRYVPPKVVVR